MKTLNDLGLNIHRDTQPGLMRSWGEAREAAELMAKLHVDNAGKRKILRAFDRFDSHLRLLNTALLGTDTKSIVMAVKTDGLNEAGVQHLFECLRSSLTSIYGGEIVQPMVTRTDDSKPVVFIHAKFSKCFDEMNHTEQLKMLDSLRVIFREVRMTLAEFTDRSDTFYIFPEDARITHERDHYLVGIDLAVSDRKVLLASNHDDTYLKHLMDEALKHSPQRFKELEVVARPQ